MSRLFFLVTLLLAVLILHAGTPADPVKIGVILPLSGNNSQVGEPMLWAVKLFENELNTHSYRHQYKLIIEDDQFVPRLSAEAVQKLIHIDHVDAIFCHGIAPGNAIAPLASRADIPMICINASYPKIADGKTNFLHWPPVEEEVDLMIKLMEKMNSSRLAILSDQHPGIASVVAQIKAKAIEHHFEIVADYTFNSGERDFRTVMGLIREKHPDTLIPFAISPEIDIIMNQRKQAGLDCNVTTFEVFNFMEDKHNAEECYYVSPSIGTPDFQARLKKITGHDSAYCVAYAYNALDLFRSAYEQQNHPGKNGHFDHAKAAEWLANLNNHPSAVGPITTDAHGVIHSPIGVFQIRNGRPVEIGLDGVK